VTVTAHLILLVLAVICFAVGAFAPQTERWISAGLAFAAASQVVT